jgi:hypothetical protein
LLVRACNDVADGAQGGRVDGVVGMDDELYQALHQVGLDDRLDARIVAVGEVRGGPASIRKNLIVSHVEQIVNDGNKAGDRRQARARLLAAAQVRDGPRAVAQRGNLGRGVRLTSNKAYYVDY